MEIERYKAVIFDLDGTLYDYQKADGAGVDAVNRYAAEHFGLTEEETKRGVREAMAEANARIGQKTASTHNRLIRYQVFCELHGYPVWPHALHMAYAYWNTFLENMDLDPDVPALFAALKKAGVQTGLGTNMTSYIQYRKLEVLGIAGKFDFVVMSEEAGLEKPDPAFFALCAAKAGAEPQQCIFIGDNHPMDYLGAKNAGMYGIWRRLDRRIPEGTPEEETVGDYRSCILPSGIRFGNAFIPF